MLLTVKENVDEKNSSFKQTKTIHVGLYSLDLLL